MDFAVIGTLSSYVKQKNLSFAAKHKIRTGQTLTNSNGNLISANLSSTFKQLTEAAKSSKNQVKAQKLALIKKKLRNGQKLSDAELGFLRVNDTKTYKKAKAADDAREELKSELKKAKTKGEAQEVLSRAMLKASSTAMSELSALDSGGNANFNGNDVQNATENNFNQADTNNLEKNSDADKDTPEDIMEKYIWTIRALEDEWAHFTNSKTYLLKAAQAYRRAMTA